MPLFRPNTVELQPTFYMFARCMLWMEKSIETVQKSTEPRANSLKTMEKSNEHFGQINEHHGKIDEQCKWQILSPKFSKVQVFAPK